MALRLFLFVMGLGLCALAAVVNAAIRGANASVPASIMDSQEGAIMRALEWGVPLLVAAVGGLLLFFAVVGTIASAQRKKLDAQLATAGADAAGVITFLDRDFTFLVNGRPVHSIVEYRFTDHNGVVHTGRRDDLQSEAVIRAGWQVGTEIPIRYLREDPTQSGIAADALG